MLQLPNHEIFVAVYGEFKFWVAVGSGFWFLFRGYNWIRSIKTNDLHHLQLGVTDLSSSINNLRDDVKEGFTGQTSSIVKELSELRADIRLALVPQRVAAAGARARRKKATKSKK